jgi:WhiB family transcriptional regulator, redox-sensing transcriptional regulator
LADGNETPSKGVYVNQEMKDALMFDVKFSPWRDEAACAGLEGVDFFPDAEDLAAIANAKAVCAGCPVAAECLTWAIDTNQSEGIWGGHTPKERRSLRRRWAEEIEKAS